MVILDITNFLGLFAAPICAGIIGVITGLYFERYKNRTLLLTHTVSFQSLGTAIRNDFWGDITISHNGRAIGHLNFITVVIKNSSRSDANGPLTFEAWLDNASQFLGQSGFYDTGNAIFLEQNFSNSYNQTLADVGIDTELRQQDPNHITPANLTAQINYLFSNRKMILPVFNRQTFITLNFLVENVAGLTPKINMSILEKGIKLIPESDKTKIESTKKIATGLITLVFYVFGLVWVFNQFTGKEQAIISTIAVGSGSYCLGYGLYYLFIYLKKIVW